MGKIIVFLFVLGLMFLLSASHTLAADGKDIYIGKCGSCHKNGGEASVFAPTKFASVQWARFFEKNKHAAVKDISSQYTETELKAVRDYLMKHAADSDQPEAVGLK